MWKIEYPSLFCMDAVSLGQKLWPVEQVSNLATALDRVQILYRRSNFKYVPYSIGNISHVLNSLIHTKGRVYVPSTVSELTLKTDGFDGGTDWK